MAAAATFLAVSWDALGLTARIAVVASATGAAIVGGHRLRRVLPAVGAVVFHLGALLLPVDALGLAYQLEASVPTRWVVVGATAVLTLPWLGAVGRSRLLGYLGLVGVPVLATGLGAAGIASPAPVVVGAGVVGLAALLRPTVQPSGPSGPTDVGSPAVILAAVLRAAAPAFAVAAVAIPFLATVAVNLVGRDTVAGQAAAAGWVQGSWVQPAVVGVVAVAVLAVLATRRRDLPMAGITIATAVMAAILTVLPPQTPRAALLLVPAVVWLLAELAAHTGRAHPLWGGPTRVVATVLEVLAALAAVSILAEVVLPSSSNGADPARVAQLVVLAAAWTVMTARIVGPGRPGAWPRPSGAGGVAVVTLAVAALHLAAAVGAAGGSDVAAGMLLTVAASTSALTLIRTTGGATLTSEAARAAAPVVAIGLLGVAALLSFGGSWTLAVVSVVPLVIGAHLWHVAALPGTGAVLRVWTLVTASGGLLAVLALSLELAPRIPGGVGVLLATVGLLALGSCAEEVDPAADSVRAVGMAAGLLMTVPSVTGLATTLGGDAQAIRAAFAIGVVPSAVVPAGIVAGWLVVDALRTRRTPVAVLAVPVVLRGVAAGLLAFGVGVPTVGLVLFALAVAAALVAATGPRSLVGPSITAAVIAAPVGWLLIGDAPVLRVVLVLLTGAALVAVGTVRRLAPVAHLGGVVVTLGSWQLFDLLEVHALDVWLLPVAGHLAVVGEVARRRGTASSWVAFVPSLLLVAVPSLVERAAGGPGWHAVLAGTVAVVGIVAGGARRLGGPLIVGTVVVVAVVLIEVFAVVAAVPTWVWLAIGGVVLLGAAASIERIGGSPVRAVRRAVQVVDERFG